MKNLNKGRTNGFTLIELLVVVLIIGILAAVALPTYQTAVRKSRFSGLMPVASTLKTAEEEFQLANNRYTGDLTELSLDLPGLTLGENDFYHYDNNKNISVNVDSTHENVRLTHDKVPGVRYVAYFNKSANFPAETHCEASTSDLKAKQLCASMGTEHGTQGSFTTYLISGAGMGTLTDAPARLVSSSEACVNNNWSNCTRKRYDDGSTVETSSSQQCSYNSAGNKTLCTTEASSHWPKVTEYNPETGLPTKKVEYSNYGSVVNSITEYDDQGRVAKIMYGDGQKDYWGHDNVDTTTYEYDPETGNKVREVSYHQGNPFHEYIYDPETGEQIAHARYNAGNGNLNYIEYFGEGSDGWWDPTEKYEFDSAGRLKSYEADGQTVSYCTNQWSCGTVGAVTSIRGKDEQGNDFSVNYNSAGNITSFSGYDEDGNYTSVNLNSAGNVTSAYGRDAEGNYFNAYYNNNGDITSYVDNGDYYYADGSMKTKNISDSEYTDSYERYDDTSYNYNQDGSFSISTEHYYDNWDTGEYESYSHTYYYDSNGVFAGAYDENNYNTYKYDTSGHYLTSVDDDEGYESYTFNSAGKVTSASTDYGDTAYSYYDNGQIKSVYADYGDTRLYFNQDGTLDSSRSYVYDYDGLEEYVADYSSSWPTQDSWGTASSLGYPSYDSWGAGNSTATQSSWGTADTSTWKQASDFSTDDVRTQDSWPTADTVTVPDYEHLTHYDTSSDAEQLKDVGNRCSDFPDTVGC